MSNRLEARLRDVMVGALLFGFFILFGAGLIALIFVKEGLQKAFVLWIGATILLFASVYTLEQQALDAGFASLQEQSEAARAGIADAETWTKRRDAVRAAAKAEQEADAKLAREAESQKMAEEAKVAGFSDSSSYLAAQSKGYATKHAYDRYLTREEFFQPPTEQLRVMKTLLRARSAYQGASNDFLRGKARSDRKFALCRILVRLRAKGWVGKLDRLTTNSDGYGVVAIEIGDDITVQTWNNTVSDAFNRTLIPPTSDVFKRLSEFKVGDRVKFSGRFFKHDVDCAHEASLTMRGSMLDPVFIVRLTKVYAAPH